LINLNTRLRTGKISPFCHYIINPGAGVGELWGQRLSTVMLIDKTSEKPLMERTYIPCPHCETLHDGRTWSKENGTATKNWFGLYCPECGGIIPCLHNATFYLLMVLTYPIWGWFKKSWKEKWLKKQPERFENISFDEIQHSKISWIKMGLGFGAFMFVIMSLYNIAFEPSNYVEILLINLPLWILGGLAFGYGMKYWMGQKGEEVKQAE
jgi:hypothetical protein